MKSFSPAGLANKALYGYDRTTGIAAKTFGNPDGNITGNGAYAAGGGGGGPSPTLAILAGDGGAGAVGYGQTFCSVVLFGAITAGAIPSFVTPGSPFEIGDNVANVGPGGFTVDIFGVFPQNSFASVQIIQLGVTLASAAADFFSNGGGCGPSTTWSWAGTVPLVIGSPYGFVFA